MSKFKNYFSNVEKKSTITRITAIALVTAMILGVIVGCSSNNDEDTYVTDPTENSTETTANPEGDEIDETTEAGTGETTQPTIINPTTDPSEETSAPTVSGQEESGESNSGNTENKGNQGETTGPTSPDNGGEGGNPNNSATYTDVNETVYATSNVNVRKGAGTSYERLGSLSKGESVTRIGVGDNGWSKVIYNGQEAYVSSSYLTKTKPESGNSNTGSGNSGSGNSGSSGSGNSGSGNNDSGSSGESETTKPTESEKVWATEPGTRPYEYQEVFSDLINSRCGVYIHCDRYGNVWLDRNASSNGYGKNIYADWLYGYSLRYYGNGLWANYGAYWSEDGSLSGGSFRASGGYFTFSDERGSGTAVYSTRPIETVTSYLDTCGNAASLYNTIMANETWSDEQKAESVAAIWPSYGVSEADVMGYINNPTTHPFPGLS